MSMEYLNEIEYPGLKEILKSAPCQTKLPTELLDWVRQVYIEGSSKCSPWELECLVRTIGIDMYYSPVQIQAALDRIKLELQNNTQKNNSLYERLKN
jgi:hypothetical protein